MDTARQPAASREEADEHPKLCRNCSMIVWHSNLEWVLCGGQVVGDEKPSYVWQLRPKGEVANEKRRTMELQRLACACRIVFDLRKYFEKNGEGDGEKQELINRMDRFLNNHSETRA